MGLSTSNILNWLGMNRKRCRLAIQILSFSMILISLNGVQAENNSTCPADSMDQCTRYRHLLADMDGGDYIAQVNSVRAASQELDPALRMLIFGKALKSSDLRLQSVGLRYVLASRSTFDVLVTAPLHPTPAQERVYGDYANLTLTRVKFDEKSDSVTALAAGSHMAEGSIIRGGFELGWSTCRLHMSAGEEDTIRGTLRCNYPGLGPVELKASIELS